MANNALGLTALTNLSSQLKTVDKAFARAVRKNVTAAIRAQGQTVLDDVRRRASWSSQIPAATSISVRYKTTGASVRIQVNHNRARHARPLEVGNRANFNEVDIQSRLSSGSARNRREAIKQGRKALGASFTTGRSLRHPVFHKNGAAGGWTEMATRPFFFPAIKEQQPNIDRALEKVVIQSARDAGFK